MIIGSRPLPAFETRGKKIIEVNPPLNKMPPTSFAFANPKHAPKVLSKRHLEGKKPKLIKKSSYSARVNELVTIKGYKGPQQLLLNLKRGLISSTDFQQVPCNLGTSLNPLIVIKSSQGKLGWKKPVARIIDWSPAKHPANSVLVLNQTKLAMMVFFSKKGKVISPGKHRHFRVSLSNKKTFRYKIQVSNGKITQTVANSQYKLRKNSRLIMVALSGKSTHVKKLPRPSLRIIADSL